MTLLIPFVMRSFWVSHSLGEMALNTPSEVGGPPLTEVPAPWGGAFLLVSFYLFLVRSHNRGKRPQLVLFPVMGLVPSK